VVTSDTAKSKLTAGTRGLLLVHAHPDDETINNGATMARYAAQGTRVTLVTCTRGELGEIIPPELADLAADRGDRLGEYRETELAAAMKELGVADHRFLGEPGEYRDSGMMGTEGNDHPDCFWRAEVDEAAERLAAVIREVRPRVLVTYNEIGGYGHPDHIQAHRVALRAVDLLEGGEYAVDRAYFNLMPRSVMASALASVRTEGEASGFSVPASADEVSVVLEEDSMVSVALDAEEFAAAKAAAMRAHATQISVHEPFYALSDGVGLKVLGTEYYRQARGDLPEPGAPVRTDLFAGLAG
jgi:N-acetyl-1-D-myo-inositol-2-amino-2-deoxy-alpha-D-glucopyranoside deacetylase